MGFPPDFTDMYSVMTNLGALIFWLIIYYQLTLTFSIVFTVACFLLIMNIRMDTHGYILALGYTVLACMHTD